MTPDDLTHLLVLPERAAPRVIAQSVEAYDGFIFEELGLDLGDGQTVRGRLTRPIGSDGPWPGVVYCHAHGARYDIGSDELLDGRAILVSSYGPVLAKAGFVSLCVDLAAFGARQTPGESALSKALSWYGKTLMGEMLADLKAAFDILASRDDVDASRIAAIGLSMGATQAYFLGALEPRLNRVAHLCCFADWATLIETGAHDRHGHYMTVPGLLAQTSTGEIAGMIAPRPQLICVGYQDPLTPRPAVERALAVTRAAYEEASASHALRLVEEQETGHVETQKMRDAMLAFLDEMKA